jgi:ferredoxin--NADP+ reductase
MSIIRDPETYERFERVLYYPTVTREPFERTSRIPLLIESGRMARELSLPELGPATDRVMICGSPAMLRDLKRLCKDRGFDEGNTGEPGDFVVERAFAEA